jgi:hypothetical protein
MAWFFRQRRAWRVIALLRVLLLAGFGFSWVKTKNRSIIYNGINTHKLRVVRSNQHHTIIVFVFFFYTLL